MRQPRSRWSFGLSSVGVVVVLAAVSALALPRLKGKGWLPRAGQTAVDLGTSPVRRTDLSVTLTTGGKVESAERTLIECQLERLEVSVKGQNLMGTGASTVIRVIPDGSFVKKGDVLCELDASEYVEMVRQQKMTVERARADHRQAELDLEVARLAVKEYEEGTLREAFKQLEGTIALNEASWKRAGDRLEWTRHMLAKGYIPKSQLSTELINERRYAFLLQQSRTELQVLRNHTAPRELRSLQGNVKGAEAILNYQDRRLRRHLDRLALLERQVENCTIRAPHDGFVIYANDDYRQIRIEEGMAVHQKQDLFYLPNLSKMVAMAMVHESMAHRIHPGMRARVRIEALPDQVLEGHVTSVAQLPTQNFLNDVRYFYTEVTLDTIPRGLRPGMTAEVEIATETRFDVLTIPVEALAVEEGRDYCYVASEEGIERRAIEVGQADSGRLEVVAGLEEGEHVVLNPGQFDDELETISPFLPEATPATGPAEVVGE